MPPPNIQASPLVATSSEKKIGQDKLNNLQLYLIGCHCRELTPDNVLLISSWRSRCTPETYRGPPLPFKHVMLHLNKTTAL